MYVPTKTLKQQLDKVNEELQEKGLENLQKCPRCGNDDDFVTEWRTAKCENCDLVVQISHAGVELQNGTWAQFMVLGKHRQGSVVELKSAKTFVFFTKELYDKMIENAMECLINLPQGSAVDLEFPKKGES